MKKEDVIFERKEFLNTAGYQGQANIVTYIIKSDWGNKDKYDRDVDIKLDIADCSRVISMDIDDYDSDARENSLHKVDTLIEVLTDLRKALKKEFKLQDRLAKKKAEEEAKDLAAAKKKKTKVKD